MQKLALNEVKAGMKLARDVVLEDGRILLLKGFTIKPRYIKKLEAYRVSYVEVEEAMIDPDEISEERVYEDAFETSGRSWNAFGMTRKLTSFRLRKPSMKWFSIY